MAEDIKLNMIIGKINRLEKLIMLLIKDHDLDHDLDLDHHNQSINDHDHEQSPSLSDQELIDWYITILERQGINPSNRNYQDKIRSIRYFHLNYASISNPDKYALTFLPKQIALPADRQDDSQNEIMGISRDQVLKSRERLTPDTIRKVLDSHPDLQKFATNKQFKSLSELTTNLITAYAIKDKLLD
jgi:hypothetical protein